MITRKYPPHLVRQIGAAAPGGGVTPRTVERYLAGLSVRPVNASRIESAMRALGLSAPSGPTPGRAA